MQNLLDELRELLQQDERLVAEGKLLKNKVVELALNLDPSLIKLLIKNENIKRHFFTDIDGVLVFDKIKFQKFVSNKQFLPDSYTAFKNKIGLVNDEGEYLSESREVVLAWPYKDCVLEGGQTKEDQKRDEVFYNETLAPDEIDRLLAPKVLTTFKRYDKDGEHKLTGDIDFSKENLIIKGNNLLALYSLKKQFTGKVKLICIDPPFNTGDDSFKYNDKFNHSTWLTFIKNRLQIAKELLSNKGIICVHIGNEEVAYLRILLDETFGRDNYLNQITLTTNDPSGFKATSSKIFSTANHILIYAKSAIDANLNKLYVEKDYDEAYKYYLANRNEHFSKWIYRPISEVLVEENGFKSVNEFKKSISESRYKELLAIFADKNRGKVFRTAAISGGALAKRKATIEKSKRTKGVVFQHPAEDLQAFYILNGEQIIFWENVYRNIDGKMVPCSAITDVWTDISWTGIAPEGDVVLKSGKKPEKLIKRLLELTTADDRNEPVLDFHLGSGTTAAVAHKMGRQYIGIEQLDYGENDSVVRLKNVINGDQSGISKAINWKGGGSFVYCELKKYNQEQIDRIHDAKATGELKAIWQAMQEKAFLSYKVAIKTVNENIREFDALSIEEQKRFLTEILDKNQLYVNYCDMGDKDYNITEEDKRLNKKFYEGV